MPGTSLRAGLTMHPLGLNLGFMFGRGYLSTQGHPVSEWITLETLRMEIPDLTFPFDARGGARRFQNTRCHVRNIRLVCAEAGMESFVRRCLAQAPGGGSFSDVRLRFLEGAAHLRLRVNTLGADTFVTFKASAIPPEPIRDDTLHIIFHDIRAYGPLPYPARLVLAEFLSQLLAAPTLHQDAPGEPFALAQRGDLLELRPLKLALLHTFPKHGWKLPGLQGIATTAIRIQPGSASITAHSDGNHWERTTTADPRADTAASPLGAQALAAYEARDLFREADAALFEGRLAAVLEQLRNMRHIYGRHPVLLEHLLDTLLTFPGPGHLAEAQSLIDELLRAQPDHLRALLAAPTLALLRGDPQRAADAYLRLADLLRERQETADLVACLLAAARVQRPYDPMAAVRLLREVVQLSPRERTALDQLRELYETQDDVDALIDVLKRLAGLTTDRDRLLAINQQLAELLMNRRNDLAEARLYLERTLRLEPDYMKALFTLGESWVLDGQPLRAIKAFGAAARFAVEHNDPTTASQLQLDGRVPET
ncbi:MAG: tetratricopeptide repeat protein [Myxococcota bacterium]